MQRLSDYTLNGVPQNRSNHWFETSDGEHNNCPNLPSNGNEGDASDSGFHSPSGQDIEITKSFSYYVPPFNPSLAAAAADARHTAENQRAVSANEHRLNAYSRRQQISSSTSFEADTFSNNQDKFAHDVWKGQCVPPSLAWTNNTRCNKPVTGNDASSRRKNRLRRTAMNEILPVSYFNASNQKRAQRDFSWADMPSFDRPLPSFINRIGTEPSRRGQSNLGQYRSPIVEPALRCHSTTKSRGFTESVPCTGGTDTPPHFNRNSVSEMGLNDVDGTKYKSQRRRNSESDEIKSYSNESQTAWYHSPSSHTFDEYPMDVTDRFSFVAKDDSSFHNRCFRSASSSSSSSHPSPSFSSLSPRSDTTTGRLHYSARQLSYSHHPYAEKNCVRRQSLRQSYSRELHETLEQRQPITSQSIETDIRKAADQKRNLHILEKAGETLDDVPVAAATRASSLNENMSDLSKNWHDTIIATLPGTVEAVRLGTWTRLRSIYIDVVSSSLIDLVGAIKAAAEYALSQSNKAVKNISLAYIVSLFSFCEGQSPSFVMLNSVRSSIQSVVSSSCQLLSKVVHTKVSYTSMMGNPKQKSSSDSFERELPEASLATALETSKTGHERSTSWSTKGGLSGELSRLKQQLRTLCCRRYRNTTVFKKTDGGDDEDEHGDSETKSESRIRLGLRPFASPVRPSLHSSQSRLKRSRKSTSLSSMDMSDPLSCISPMSLRGMEAHSMGIKSSYKRENRMLRGIGIFPPINYTAPSHGQNDISLQNIESEADCANEQYVENDEGRSDDAISSATSKGYSSLATFISSLHTPKLAQIHLSTVIKVLLDAANRVAPNKSSRARRNAAKQTKFGLHKGKEYEDFVQEDAFASPEDNGSAEVSVKKQGFSGSCRTPSQTSIFVITEGSNEQSDNETRMVSGNTEKLSKHRWSRSPFERTDDTLLSISSATDSCEKKGPSSSVSSSYQNDNDDAVDHVGSKKRKGVHIEEPSRISDVFETETQSVPAVSKTTTTALLEHNILIEPSRPMKEPNRRICMADKRKLFQNSIVRRGEKGIVVCQRPVVDSDSSHPHDQTDFAPLLGLTVFHFVRSLGITEKKGSWEALLYLLTFLHNCKLDHLAVQQALLFAMILQDRRKGVVKRRILEHPECRYRRTVSRPSPFLPWTDVRSMEVVWSLFVSLWLSLIWLEDRRTPVLGWIEILCVLPEPTEYLQGAGFGVPHPLYSRTFSVASYRTEKNLDQDQKGSDQQQQQEQQQQRDHFLPEQFMRRRPTATTNPRLLRRSAAALLSDVGEPHHKDLNQQKFEQTPARRKEDLLDYVSCPVLVDASREDLTQSAIMPSHHQLVSTSTTTSFIRRSTTIRRRLHLPTSQRRIPPSTIVTDVSHCASRSSQYVTSQACTRRASGIPSPLTLSDGLHHGRLQFSQQQQQQQHGKGEDDHSIVRGRKPPPPLVSGTIHRSRTDLSTTTCPRVAEVSHLSAENRQTNNRNQQEHTRTTTTTNNSLSHLSHPYGMSKRISGTAYHHVQQQQHRHLNGDNILQVRSSKCQKKSSLQTNIHDAAVQKRVRLKRLFVAECSRFYEDLDYRLDVSPYEVQQKWEDISRSAPFPTQPTRSVIGETFGDMAPMLLYEEHNDDPKMCERKNQMLMLPYDGPDHHQSSSLCCDDQYWLRTKIVNTLFWLVDVAGPYTSIVQNAISLWLLAVGLPLVVTTSLALWTASQILLPPQMHLWICPLINESTQLCSRVVSFILPVPNQTDETTVVVDSSSINPQFDQHCDCCRKAAAIQFPKQQQFESNNNKSTFLTNEKPSHSIKSEKWTTMRSRNDDVPRKTTHYYQSLKKTSSPLLGAPHSGFRVVLNDVGPTTAETSLEAKKFAAAPPPSPFTPFYKFLGHDKKAVKNSSRKNEDHYEGGGSSHHNTESETSSLQTRIPQVKLPAMTIIISWLCTIFSALVKVGSHLLRIDLIFMDVVGSFQFAKELLTGKWKPSWNSPEAYSSKSQCDTSQNY